jgi:hypothetical protein
MRTEPDHYVADDMPFAKRGQPMRVAVIGPSPSVLRAEEIVTGSSTNTGVSDNGAIRVEFVRILTVALFTCGLLWLGVAIISSARPWQ